MVHCFAKAFPAGLQIAIEDHAGAVFQEEAKVEGWCKRGPLCSRPALLSYRADRMPPLAVFYNLDPWTKKECKAFLNSPPCDIALT